MVRRTGEPGVTFATAYPAQRIRVRTARLAVRNEDASITSPLPTQA
jgi:hypothetical protein